MRNVIELNEKCQSCKGTGLYIGMCERDGAAVVCPTCKGTGCHKFKHEYKDFTGRLPRDKVARVYQANPGICIGNGCECSLRDFGGMSYADWLKGKPFTPGMEDRGHTCPSWFYQTADYKLKPKWDECFANISGCFSDCPNFATKAKCWARFDAERC